MGCSDALLLHGGELGGTVHITILRITPIPSHLTPNVFSTRESPLLRQESPVDSRTISEPGEHPSSDFSDPSQ